MRLRAVTAACLAAAAVAVVLVLPQTAPSHEKTTALRRAPLQWGLYQILWSRRFGDQLDAQIARFASRPNYVMFFRDLGRPFPKSVIDAIATRGATAIVSLELWQWHDNHGGSYLPDINAGKFDDFFRKWARDAKSDGRRVLLRFGFEFNGDWFTWGGNPQQLVGAWRRAHRIFQDEGADKVEWVWAPNVVSVPDKPENDMHRYYPGDAYVDWIGVDGYNFGEYHDVWHKWQSFAEVFDAVLTDYEKRYADKPVMITEFGCAPGKPGRQAMWIREAYNNLLARPHVRAAVWFNFDKRREGEPNWRVDTEPDSLRVFNATFAAPQAVAPAK
ncbi:MAG: glycosyl hydrolase [Phycisphaerae bacterium]